jgi:hypothetical protein
VSAFPKQLPIQLPEDLRSRIEAEAKRNDRSLAAEIRVVLREYFQSKERELTVTR